tara:strand:+ start:2031 stop:3728 length:1698 start_codon:yes stop_codon:yes gene_type:complete
VIRSKINKIVSNFNKYNIDGYIVPKNDNFFSEYVSHDRLNIISNFTGSAGFAIIFKNKNYLFVDGRYTLQANKESGKNFKIVEFPKFLPKSLFENITLGYDPTLFTKLQLQYFFGNKIKLISINENLVDVLRKPKNTNFGQYYFLPRMIAGKSHKYKLSLVSNIIKKNKSDYLFISAPENVSWLLNIRGSDVPFSPIINCNCLVGKNKKILLIGKKNKFKNLLKKRLISKNQIIDPKNLIDTFEKLKGKNFIIDGKTCSVFNERLITKKFHIKTREDPCYLLKAKKNSAEINNMIKSHVEDGIALTKFIFWIKNYKHQSLTELDAEKMLEHFRKQSKSYLYPSFNTIAGSGPNGAIVHYRAKKKTNRKIKSQDIFLCDSGGQYKYGTTDVTRTMCFSKPSKEIKKIFTLVLKGHIAVVTSDLNKNKRGYQLDIRARKFLKEKGFDFKHGTGHGVGFFSNVHEGPQSISKYNKVKLAEGMILSNEPGYYRKGKFGIRIENLIFIKKFKRKLVFENLTLVPIDKDLIEYKMLTKKEKDYIFQYHLNVYSKLSSFLNLKEKKWLIKQI